LWSIRGPIVNQFLRQTSKGSVLKPGPARRVDPGLGPVQVEVKTHSGVGQVKPGRPGPPDQTRLRPGLYFFFILIDVKRRRFVLYFKGQNDEEQWSRIGHFDYRANLINKKINFNRWAEEQRRAEDVLIIVVSLQKRLVSCFCSQIFFFHSLFSLFLAVFWTCSSGHHFAICWFSLVDSVTA